MRSTTIFIVFGALILGVLVFSNLSTRSNAKRTEVKVVADFLRAYQNGDLDEINALLDTEMVAVLPSGSGKTQAPINLNFKAFAPPNGGAFTKRPAISWGPSAISALQIDTAVRPAHNETDTTAPQATNAGAIVAVAFTDGNHAYLRQTGAEWKIIYIDRKDDSGQ